jgi:hypothetical protein
MVIRSVADTPVNMIVAFVPEPENRSRTSPGGTPVNMNCPPPSMTVEMLVPTTATLTAAVAMVSKAGRAPIAAMPLTRPMITAPRDPSIVDEAVGDVLDESHAARHNASTARSAHALERWIMDASKRLSRLRRVTLSSTPLLFTRPAFAPVNELLDWNGRGAVKRNEARCRADGA